MGLGCSSGTGGREAKVSRYPWPPRKEIPEDRIQEMRGRGRPHAGGRLWRKETGVTAALNKESALPQTPPAFPTPSTPQPAGTFQSDQSRALPHEQNNQPTPTGFNSRARKKMGGSSSQSPTGPPLRLPPRRPQGPAPGKPQAPRCSHSTSVATAPSRPEAAAFPDANAGCGGRD